MNQVLLTVSGTIKENIYEEIIKKERPMADYIQMAETFGADLIDYPKARQATGKFGRILEKVGGANLVLAWACFQLRAQYKVIFTDGEQVGIPLAALFKLFAVLPFVTRSIRPKHLMIVHILSVGKKMMFFDYLKLYSHIDTFFVYSTWQKRFIEERWKVEPERVVLTPFMVDANFFAPQVTNTPYRDSLPFKHHEWPVIAAVGLEFRDYPTLMKAVEGVEVNLIIAAGSPWSKRVNSAEKYAAPENVLVKRFTLDELRDVYAMSNFITMPLYHVNFQAGVTAILEAMAMEKAIICTSTPGQTDVVIHDQNGYYVPPEDPITWRYAIRYLLEHPHEALRMGKFGRWRIENEMSLDRYTERLNYYVQRALGKTTTNNDFEDWGWSEEDEDLVLPPQLWTPAYQRPSNFIKE